MEAWCDEVGQRPLLWAQCTDGVYPAYCKLAGRVVTEDSVKLHEYAAHLRSSQAFALNLFLPFREGSRTKLAECVGCLIGTPLSIDRVQFEWVPPGPLLGEIVGERPMDDEPATAVDVVLWSRLPDGQRAAVLLEVKLTEDGFTNCNGRPSRGNRRKDVCDSARMSFNDPAACYLRRPHGKRRDRRYWEIFGRSHGSVRNAFPGAPLEGRCPFSFHAQQPMRNLAIARGMEQDENSVVSRAWFACVPTTRTRRLRNIWMTGGHCFRIRRWRLCWPRPTSCEQEMPRATAIGLRGCAIATCWETDAHGSA